MTVQQISYSGDLDANMLHALNGKSAKLVMRNEIEEMRGKHIQMVPATDERKNSLLNCHLYCVACDNDVSLHVKGDEDGEWRNVEDVMGD